MSDKPIISLFGSAIRTDLWMRLYRSLMSNKVPWELVLVGDRPPDFDLPKNFRYIYSPVKPAQCYEIGARYAEGDLIIPVSDCEIFSDGAVDRQYKEYVSHNNDKFAVGIVQCLPGEDISTALRRSGWHFTEGPNSPLALYSPLIKRDLWMDLGGIDRRFIALYGDMDMVLRIYEIGGTGVMLEDVSALEDHQQSKFKFQRILEEYGWPHDWPLLNVMWKDMDDKMAKNRRYTVEPFTDDDILAVSQGNKGRWVANNMSRVETQGVPEHWRQFAVKDRAMVSKPIISLFGSAVRTDLWMRLYRSLMSNKVPWELVLVGDRPPDFDLHLPKNFRYIYSPVKPAQCFEIGARYAEGDLIIPVEDGNIFNDGALDSLYREYTFRANDKILVSCRYILDGRDETGRCHYFWERPDTPIAPVCPLMKKNLWRQLDGADRRFITSYFDVDMAMRIYGIGGEAIINKDAYVEEAHKPSKFKFQRLVEEYGIPFDRPLLDSFWVKDGKIVKNRLSPLEPFTNDNILTVSQGNKGRWP